MPEVQRYVALLRGINVGGNKKIRMQSLREMLSTFGFARVKTVLASGNAAFDSAEADMAQIVATIEVGIEAVFGFPVRVIVRRLDDINALVEADPFAGVEVTEQTRLYVTFRGSSEPPAQELSLPYTAAEGNFTILRVTDSEVCSVLTLTENSRTTKGMDILQDIFGRHITTRNWNTVLKLATL